MIKALSQAVLQIGLLVTFTASALAAEPDGSAAQKFYESLEQQNVAQEQNQSLVRKIQAFGDNLGKARGQTEAERRDVLKAAGADLKIAIEHARRLSSRAADAFPKSVSEWTEVKAIGAAQAKAQAALEALEAIETQLANAAATTDLERLRGELDRIRLDLEGAAAEVRMHLDAIEHKYRPLAGVIVSGGVSLGSYQAGFLHYYTQFMLAHNRSVSTVFARTFGETNERRPGGFRIATGASAGSINAFLSGISGCRQPVADPTKSLFYATWVPVGIEGLIRLSDVQVNGLLSRSPIENAINNLRHLWEEKPHISGWNNDVRCETFMGFSATRMQARTIDVRENDTMFPLPSDNGHAPIESVTRVQKQTEQFILSMKGNGAAPSFAAFRPPVEEGATLSEFFPVLGHADPVRAHDGDSVAVGIGDVTQLLAASSSFPLAFPPIPLSYAIWNATGKVDPLTHQHVYRTTKEQTRFIDGGVFDNTPLGLAIDMRRWIETKKLAKLPARFMFLSSGTIGWRKGDAARQKKLESRKVPTNAETPVLSEAETIFDDYLPFIADFVSTAENTQLLNTIESHHDVVREIPARMVPIMGEQLANFFAFFEQDFRRFDFYIGMVDALEHVAARSPEAFALVSGKNGLVVDSALFSCFSEHRTLTRQGAPIDPKEIPACQHATLKNERNMLALLRVSTELKQYTESDQYDDKKEFSHLLSLLEKRGYEYKELRFRGESATGSTVVRAIRDHLQNLLHAMGSKQERFMPKQAVWVTGKAAANYFDYRPELHRIGVGGDLSNGGLQIDYSLLLGGQTVSLRGGASLRATKLDRRAVLYNNGEQSTAIGVTLEPRLGLTAQWAVNPAFQLELGASANFRFIPEILDPIERPFLMQFGYENTLTAVAFQRLFLALSTAYYPRTWEPNGRASLPGDLNRFWLHLVFGWRFLFD